MPCVFSLHTLSKIFNLLLPSAKNAATFSPLFAIRKNPHFQAPACTCLFLRTAKNLFTSKCLKNIALQTVSSQNRKNVVFRLVAQLFFLSTHCQKSFSVLSSKIFYTVLSAPTTGHSHCPNHWGKSIINFLLNFSLLNQFLICSAHCPNNFG